MGLLWFVLGLCVSLMFGPLGTLLFLLALGAVILGAKCLGWWIGDPTDAWRMERESLPKQ